MYILENKTPLRVLDGCGSKAIHLLGFLEKKYGKQGSYSS